jgi:hypothetical protein
MERKKVLRMCGKEGEERAWQSNYLREGREGKEGEKRDW